MASCEIGEVRLRATNTAKLVGRGLDAPKPGTNFDGYFLQLEGWAIGRDQPVVAIEVVHQGSNVWQLETGVQRLDVAAAFPEVPTADRSGFRESLSTLRLLPDFELTLHCVLGDGARVVMGTIGGRRRPLRTSFEPSLQPLLITTLGRTGSTWLMRILDSCPGVVAYRPFEYEPRVATYWMEVARALSEPASYLQQVAPIGEVAGTWWLGSHTAKSRIHLHDSHLQGWLTGQSVEDLAMFCQARIEALYVEAARESQKPEAVYFAEKYLPDQTVPSLMRELYPSAREVILVRDFRDMVASILAFNAKRGYAAFGRGRAMSDRDYVMQLRSSVGSLMGRWQHAMDDVHVVRYEDLLLEPATTVMRLLESLGLEASPGAVAAIIDRASRETPEMRDHRTADGAIASIGRWKNDLTADVQAACEEAFGSALNAFGYELAPVALA